MSPKTWKILLSSLGITTLISATIFFIFFHSNAETIPNSAPTATANFDTADEKTEITATSQNIDLSNYASGSIIKINSAGEYILGGKITNGQIAIDVSDTEKVQLYLNNIEITTTTATAILVSNAEKVIITLNEATTNTITTTKSDNTSDPDAAIFAHDDLTINGTGSLLLNANSTGGIESRDDLKITGGNISITSTHAGLFGNKSVEIKQAHLTISSEEDGIHSDGDMIIESGNFIINSADDGMHADNTLTISGGTIDIKESYEGIEATNIVINGGNISIIASDDGLNGAGGNDDNSSSPTTNSGRDRPQDNFSSNSGSITITGGTLLIAAAGSGSGDGLDANGTITITGGDTVIKTPPNPRDYAALDADGAVSIASATIRSLSTNGIYTEITSGNTGHPRQR